MVKRLLHIPTASYWTLNSVNTYVGRFDINWESPNLVSYLLATFGDTVYPITDTKFMLTTSGRNRCNQHEFEIVEED